MAFNFKKLLGKALKYAAPIVVAYAAEAAEKEVQKRITKTPRKKD